MLPGSAVTLSWLSAHQGRPHLYHGCALPTELGGKLLVLQLDNDIVAAILMKGTYPSGAHQSTAPMMIPDRCCIDPPDGLLIKLTQSSHRRRLRNLTRPASRAGHELLQRRSADAVPSTIEQKTPHCTMRPGVQPGAGEAGTCRCIWDRPHGAAGGTAQALPDRRLVVHRLDLPEQVCRSPDGLVRWITADSAPDRSPQGPRRGLELPGAARAGRRAAPRRRPAHPPPSAAVRKLRRWFVEQMAAQLLDAASSTPPT